MSFLEFFWNSVVAIVFLGCLANIYDNMTRRRPSDDCGCSVIFLLISGAILCFSISSTIAGSQPTYTQRYPMRFTMWNRYMSSSSKYGYQVTNYRKPNAELPAAEYMMGVEMAKSNTCSEFDFGRLEDIDRFKRCTHFFPELTAEYRTHYEERVGICI
jgi:hypothetical protein